MAKFQYLFDIWADLVVHLLLLELLASPHVSFLCLRQWNVLQHCFQGGWLVCVRSQGDEIHKSARDSICSLIFHTFSSPPPAHRLPHPRALPPKGSFHQNLRIMFRTRHTIEFIIIFQLCTYLPTYLPRLESSVTIVGEILPLLQISWRTLAIGKGSIKYLAKL